MIRVGGVVRGAFHGARGLASKAKSPGSSGSQRVGDLIDTAAAANPLKDAFKFFETTAQRAMVWANRDVKMFSDAVAAGMDELGYKSGDRLAVWMPFGSPEFVAIALGSARIGVAVAPIAPPTDKLSADVGPVVAALDAHSPRGFLFWHEYSTPLPEDFVWNAEDDGINPLTERLFPAIREDTFGLRGVTRITGRPFASARFPSVRHVIHTGHRNWRQLLQFRSIMRFDADELPSAAAVDGSAVLLASDTDKEAVLQGDLCGRAAALAQRLKLSGDHALETGKLVVPTQASAAKVLEGAVSALSTGSLCVFPSFAATLSEAQGVAGVEAATLQN